MMKIWSSIGSRWSIRTRNNTPQSYPLAASTTTPSRSTTTTKSSGTTRRKPVPSERCLWCASVSSTTFTPIRAICTTNQLQLRLRVNRVRFPPGWWTFTPARTMAARSSAIRAPSKRLAGTNSWTGWPSCRSKRCRMKSCGRFSAPRRTTTTMRMRLSGGRRRGRKSPAEFRWQREPVPSARSERAKRRSRE
uniref:(northern house mosquito) hypothetical protein n=1 Tax=Culex pipiens TaxID=7175 RepID=A0A8D8CAP4_CULPI